MIKKILNLVSGKTIKWNRMRNPILTNLDSKIQSSKYQGYASQFNPFVYCGVLLVDDYLSPHRSNDTIKFNVKNINTEKYLLLVEIAASSLVQLYLNLPNENEKSKEIIRLYFIDCFKNSKINYEDLAIYQHQKSDDINLQQISSFMLGEFRRIVDAKPADFLEDLSAYAYVGPTFQMVQELKIENKLPRLIND